MQFQENINITLPLLKKLEFPEGPRKKVRKTKEIEEIYEA